MEKENLKGLKMEDNWLMGQDHPHPSPPPFSAFTGQRSSLFEKIYSQLQQPPMTTADLPPAPAPPPPAYGFMELLSFQGFENLSSVMNGISAMTSPSAGPWNLKGASSVSSATTTANNNSSGFLEASEVLNPLPTTPNSSSISSASNDELAIDDNPVKEEDRCWDQKDHDHELVLNKTLKQLKPKKTNQKKQREPRFAFMTKSEVDHLEDGYRWRKYGQKAVKNSPFPRSYYRCTTTTCNVKKRVERCFNDPSIVVTTYEGQHTHPSPVMARGGGGGGGLPTGFLPHPGFSGGDATLSARPCSLPNQVVDGSSYFHENYIKGCLPTFSLNQSSTTTPPSSLVHGRRSCHPSGGAAVLRDKGLLEDIVPSHMIVNEE